MTTFNTDFAYRQADDQRSRAMGWRISIEALAYVVVIGASVVTFGLSVLGRAL